MNTRQELSAVLVGFGAAMCLWGTLSFIHPATTSPSSLFVYWIAFATTLISHCLNR